MDRNKGFTLIEVIVVIAIMSVLIGVLAPSLFRYVNKSRAEACRTDREAILAVLERCIYSGAKKMESDDLNKVLVGDDPATQHEIQQYYKLTKGCPAGGSYEVAVDGTTVTLLCDRPEHNEVMFVDFFGWNGAEREEKDDEPLTMPSIDEFPKPVVPAEEESSSSASGEEEDAETAQNSIWPYADDSRWDGAGPGQYVEIEVPSGLVMSEEGYQYVFIEKDGKQTFKVLWEWKNGPENIDFIREDQCVLWSGVEIMIEEDTVTDEIILNYGDMINYQGIQYIYAPEQSQEGEEIVLPNPADLDGKGPFYQVNPEQKDPENATEGE